MAKIELGSDWEWRVDAANNRCLIEYTPNGIRFALNEDGSFSPLDGGLDLNGNNLSHVGKADVTNLTVDGESSGLHWEEDGNSPFSRSGTASSTTLSLNTSIGNLYSMTKIFYIFRPQDTSEPLEVTFNGYDASGNGLYYYEDPSGTETTGADSIRLADFSSTYGVTSGVILITDNFDITLRHQGLVRRDRGTIVAETGEWRAHNVTSADRNPTEITFHHSGASPIQFKAQVYHRSIDT